MNYVCLLKDLLEKTLHAQIHGGGENVIDIVVKFYLCFTFGKFRSSIAFSGAKNSSSNFLGLTGTESPVGVNRQRHHTVQDHEFSVF